jgi:NAD(P)H-dependent flavin oxidoreductase YrpB (nitropropane dioxygenase family)
VLEHATQAQLMAQISVAHRHFVVDLLARHGIAVAPDEVVRDTLPTLLPEVSGQLLDVAFSHPIRLIANALGIAPASMIARAKAHGVPVASLVGAKEHALRQVQAGVDIIVAQGGEAGGHCGEVSTLVLIPEVVRAIRKVRDVPVLAAGGIMTGAQMAGCMAMGAEGAWTGSVWLATTEAETTEAFREKMVQARSRDTVRSRSRTGKPARQLRSAWHDAWDSDASPGALPMPLMGMVSQAAFRKINKSVEGGNPQALPLVSYFVGQGVGLIEQVRSATQVVQAFKEEFAESFLGLQAQINE